MNYIAITLRIFSALWSIRTTKHILFYLYLWQLKEYQFKRFVDHFRTEKGKQLLYGKSILFKVVLFFLIFFIRDYNLTMFFLILLSLVYFLESLVFLNSVFDNKFKKPVLTFKTAFLIILLLLVEVGYFFLVASRANRVLDLLLWLLGFDILTPVIVSIIVMAFQPFFAYLRNSIVRKAAKKRKELNINSIGITGSYGKTTVKEFLAQILSKEFDVLKTKEHQNSEIGIANCVLKDLTKDKEVFVAEMGAYRKGGIKFLCNIVSPKIGIAVGANEQHLALFGSLDNLVSAEGGVELSECVETMIVNWDNELIKENIDKFKGRIIKCSLKGNADLYAEDIKVEKEWVSFKIKGISFKVNSAGKFNVMNLLLAIACALELKMSLEEIADACNSIKLSMSPIKIIKHDNLTILDSTYSSNPDGAIADLEYLNIYQGKKIVVMPSLIELGEASKEIHERIGAKINEVCDLAIITTADNFKELKGNSDKVKLIKSPNKIKGIIHDFCKDNECTVLLEGRGPHLNL